MRARRDLVRRTAVAIASIGAIAGGAACASVSRSAAVAAAPAPPSTADRLTSDDFARMLVEMSEPGGFFRSDNFVSNEVTFQRVLPELARTVPPNGVYLGVGPEQNFTYIAATRPSLAFIVDIRRQNMIEQLMYKAVMELSPTRERFLELLFSRHAHIRPSDVAIDTLLADIAASAPDSLGWRGNLSAIRFRLTRVDGIPLDATDSTSLDYVYDAFFDAGPALTYSFGTGRGGRVFFGRRMPTFAQLMVERDALGVERSWLATEGSYAIVRRMQQENRIVPLVGDFAGEHTLHAIGDYLRARNATVSMFYTSNVEQYLFQQNDDWRKFYVNVASLPIDARSVFIRSLFNFMAMRDPSVVTGAPSTARSVTVLQPIGELLRAFAEGRIVGYGDLAGVR